ncbi:AMP-binding protein [Lachnoclostridium sp. Marseille-P6806]|uniref:AMP-binding protein n=1 Tax=Lachnoclostridium sp. Marseille-P6806 TaxID=2364793 RepID=UPI003569F30E
MITRENTKTIYDLVCSAGDSHGDHVFLRYEDNDVIYEVTYRQFVADCMAVAAWAQEKSRELGHPVRVGLLGGSGHHYLAVMLGVMASGSVIIPMDVQMDADTFCDCVSRSDEDVLFYDWDFRTLAEEAGSRCPALEECISLQHGRHVACSDNILKNYAGRPVENLAKPEECAMILFTSGTTGRGKGVMLSHGNLIDNVFCTTDTEHPENEIYLNVLPMHHVFCINGDVLIVIRYGSTLCLNRDMTKLAAHILLFEPTVMRMVPMMAKGLYNRIAIMSRQQPGKSLFQIKEEVLGKRLHKVVSGGGYLAPELAANYSRLGISIAQGYGMSECSPKISSPDWNRPDKVASVGKLVEGCQVRIVDEEIQVKSPSVMMGYYKEPDKTAEAITEDGWLCTGDIGYLDEEGFLYLTGRKKNLIILSNGENVAPEQLENLFEDERLIEDILVFGEDDAICAEVYPNFKYAEAANISDIEGTVQEIIKKHNQKLPSYKRIMQCRIRAVPFAKTSSKKIIRNQYFTKKKEEKEQEAQVRRPENELQEKLYTCVSNVLGHSRFGIDTELYEAGLDSMGSVLLLTDLYNDLKISITLDELMSHASILKLEAVAKEKEGQGRTDYSWRTKYPLTGVQMFFAYVMRGNTTANLPFFYRLDPRVDLRLLKRSVEQVFELHPELKDVIQFDQETGAYMNFRDDWKEVNIPIHHLTDAQWEEEKNGLLRPYTYGPGEPLYHIALYQTETEKYFFMDVAHIMGDGMTMNVLFEDINALYAGKAAVPSEYTYYEYILDEKKRDEEGGREENIRYFTEQMKDLKIRRSILTKKEHRGLDFGINAALRNRFEKINRKKLTAFCHENGVSENVVFLTAYNYCISLFSNEKDTVSTSIHSGRTDSRWNRLAGPLFRTYYFRYTENKEETVAEMLKRSGRQIMETMRCYMSNLHADEMFFQYQGDILNINTIGGYPAERQRIQLDSLPFHLQVFSDDKGYYYELRYWENRFDRQQLQVFMTAVECVAEAMMDEHFARRLKRYLPEELFPKHYFVEAGTINWEAGSRLITDVSAETMVKAYVLDENCRKKPFGGWGTLYIMDHKPADCVDQITNPYGPGVLYQTSCTARILPDGSIHMLEQGGRIIMTESLTGRHFLDLYRLEDTACQYPGVERAEAYVAYGAGNTMVLTLDVYGKNQLDTENLQKYLTERCEKPLIPAVIHCMDCEIK